MTRANLILFSILTVTAAQAQKEMSLDEAKRLLRGQQQAFVAIAKQITPTIVHIQVERERRGRGFAPLRGFDDLFDMGPVQEIETGSGVIIRNDGVIITNDHIVRGVKTCKVSIGDGLLVDGKVLGSDPVTDIAVVKVDAKNLPVAKWGDSDKLQVGEWVIAVGNPYGLDKTVTAGIVSAKGRQGLGALALEDFIQTDAAINPGNSGGALVNVDGELIGINSMIYTESGGNVGIGFAIPSKMAKQIAQQIIEKGPIERGWIGILPAPTQDHAATVYQIYRNSPAHLAGLHQGDEIIEYGGKKVERSSQLRTLVATDKPGKKINLTVLRDGQKITVSVSLEKLPLRDDGTPYQGI